jgi:hypothetical protein
MSASVPDSLEMAAPIQCCESFGLPLCISCLALKPVFQLATPPSCAFFGPMGVVSINIQAVCSRRAALLARSCGRGPAAAARRRALQEAEQQLAQLRLTVGGN